MQRTTDLIAAVLGIGAFAVAVLAGLAAGNDPIGVVVRALLAMVACSLLGRLIGMACVQAIGEHLERYAQANPVPEIAPDPRDRQAPLRMPSVENS